ncbi:unnamed protein product [Aphanomyces euteiches]
MGTAESVPSRPKLRDLILLRLHLALAQRQECLETWLLHEFQKHDPSNTGTIPRESLWLIAETNAKGKLRQDDCRRVADVFDLHANGRFHYMQFVWFVLPPGRMFTKEDKTIGTIGIYTVDLPSSGAAYSAWRWRKVEDTRNHIALLASLAHPNLLRYIGSSLTDSTLRVCQEWSEATAIRTILANFGRMSEPTIHRYVSQVVEGVLYLHERDILHRDIHGESVYIDVAGVAKLGEFGVGPILRAMTTSKPTDTIYTKFQPPEARRDGAWGKKADVWTIGLLALEMLYGTAVLNTPAVVPPIPDSISPAFRAFFLHCFETNPRNRATAEELSLHPFFQMVHDTNSMLSEVCSSLDVTMRRLKESIPGG